MIQWVAEAAASALLFLRGKKRQKQARQSLTAGVNYAILLRYPKKRRKSLFLDCLDLYWRNESMRTKITLACTECKQRNYDTMKNKKNDPDRLEISKYCKFCKKHTPHRETK